MTKEDFTISKEEAKKVLLVSKGMVHTFYNLPFGLVGGDHDLKSLLKEIDNAYQVKLTKGQALAMGHGIVIIPQKIYQQSDILFVETTEKFNKEQQKKLEKEIIKDILD